MIRKMHLIVLALSAILLLSSCSANSKSATARDTIQTHNDEISAAEPAVDQSVAPDGSASTGNAGTAAIDPGSVQTSDKKIIYTVDMSIEAKDAAAAINQISAETVAVGGYVSNSNYSKADDIASGYITVRIPPEKLKDFTAKIGTLGTVESSNMGSQDVTADYVDIESRLTNAKAQEAQMLTIMTQAVKMEDILNVRAQLDSIQEEIEVLKGQLRYYDNLVGYSTVTIRITEPAPAPVSPTEDPNSGLLARWSTGYVWQNVVKGFSNSISFVANTAGFFAILLSYILVPVLIIAAIILLIVFLVKRAGKKKARAKQTK
jgi:hypothetical protein